MHDQPARTPTLIKAALLHAQFETIHPFLDGNGRLGRLFILLLLCYEKALSQPLLYLSLYIKSNRDTYYQLLQSVRMQGDWEEWLLFFLTGVAETAEQATGTARSIFQLIDAETVQIEAMGRVAGSILRLHHWMQKKPVFTIAQAAESLNLSMQTIINGIGRLKRIGVVSEITGRQRSQVFTYDTLLKVLGE